MDKETEKEGGDMKEIAASALDKFAEVLYAIAPGFVLLIALGMASTSGEYTYDKLFPPGAEWRGVVVGVLLGLISYAIHLTVLEDVFMQLILWLKRKKSPPAIQDLTRSRWARLGSTGPQAAAQAGLDETYLWVFFLYCSGYLLIVGGFLVIGQPNGWQLVVGGVLCLLLAFVGDWKTTSHEILLIDAPLPTRP
jgi:hypothetical protein